MAEGKRMNVKGPSCPQTDRNSKFRPHPAWIYGLGCYR